MNGNKLFLDTNIILYLLNGDETLAELLNDKQLYISVITELELLAFKGITKKEEKIIIDFIDQCKRININTAIKQETIRIRKAYNLKLPDSIIVATALYLGLPLITSDIEFKKVEELVMVQYDIEL
ncbi:type II toxin-antitoxin system VapC family toxin [Galbibacter sp. EGI 63066]|uniref:type II toxin-antitoxin system VapC family toxin n=1 Tax=Galbibacter sp. EGI 63066 TaxID=2993559 RepID=UPI002249960C|nr:type II toxin-antitoxin system VapC family toxin [Galbibacter sp. EGI 63066]MCX2679584.1 type II toxin-antitoxin system VapC family toxin [Galbibacter sp. EGI 63066]